jgi:hypothetical protein
MRRYLSKLVVATWLSAATTPSTWAEDPKTAPPANQLQGVLERIHQHVASGDGKKEGLQDDQIEAWLDKLVASIAKAANRPDLKVPVRLADVKPVELPERGINAEALFVGRDFEWRDLSTFRKSIVLADGNVKVDRLEDCVIIARGAVDVRSTAQNCVIVAGAFAKVSRDGGDFGREAPGSLIVSRGWAEVQSANGSIVAAPEGATIGSSQNALFINASFAGRDRGGSKTIKVPDLPLEAMPAHPLSNLIKVQGVVHVDGTDPRWSGNGGYAAATRSRISIRRPPIHCRAERADCRSSWPAGGEAAKLETDLFHRIPGNL